VQTGHDFSQYKLNTELRRIERRMAVQLISNLDDYVKFMQRNLDEADALFNDLLIGVTSFFRDPEVFTALEQQVIPKLFADKPRGSSIRVWSAGCSTGEEAYSIAILLQEQLEALKQSYKWQVFASDIDSRAIATARIGVYPASIATDISPERLARFFTLEPDGSSYRISKTIRDGMIFSEHNVIKDPPFSKLDLLSCRNLLIYMSGELQKKLLLLFHYALNVGGYMLLGTSESVGDYGNLFNTLDRSHKFYQTQPDYDGSSHAVRVRAQLLTPVVDTVSDHVHLKPDLAVKISLRELTEQTLLQHAAAVGILVDSQGNILYIHGRTGRYLEPAAGEVRIDNVLKMARQGLRNDLTVALNSAVKNKLTEFRPRLSVKTNGEFTAVNLWVIPVSTAKSSGTTLYLVILTEAAAEPAGKPADNGATVPDSGDDHTSIAGLRQELRVKDEFLTASNEELATSNEELKSANEEMQSVNEELQSANEELETSREELQSVNEELATVNTELQNKVADLTKINNDMNNLLAGTGVGTIFVDLQLRILRFTPAITKIVNLIPGDVGRPVAHIASNLIGYDRLVEDTQKVLDTLIPQSIVLQAKDGRSYTLRIIPYRTLDNVIMGAVITFVDVTELRSAETALQLSEARYRGLVTHLETGILIYDQDGQVLTCNARAATLLGLKPEQILGGWSFCPEYQVIDGVNSPLTPEQAPFRQIIATQLPFKSQLLGIKRPDSAAIGWLKVTGFPVLDSQGAIVEIILSFVQANGAAGN